MDKTKPLTQKLDGAAALLSVKAGNGAHSPAGVDLDKTVLVTGGAGFIGRRLVQRLLAEDLTTCVVVVDNGTTGSISLLTETLDQRIQNPERGNPLRTAIVQGDVRELKSWQAVAQALSRFQFPPVREVYHLACPACPTAWERQPADTTLSAVMGTHQAAVFAGEVVPFLYPELGPAKLVHLSSAAVYGGTDPVDGFAVAEDYAGFVPFTGPRACYDEGKRAAEALLDAWARTSKRGLDARVVRPFTVYGPGMHPDDGRLLTRLIVAALTDQPLRIDGDGSRGLSLIHVDDVVEALLQVMSLPQNPGPLNLGDADGEISVTDLASAVLRCVPGTSSAVAFGPDAGSLGRARPDLAKVTAALPGWKRTKNVFEGVAETVEDLKAHLARIEEEKRKKAEQAAGGGAHDHPGRREGMRKGTPNRPPRGPMSDFEAGFVTGAILVTLVFLVAYSQGCKADDVGPIVAAQEAVVPLPASQPLAPKDDELPRVPEVPPAARGHTFDLGLDLRDPDGHHTIMVIPGFRGWQACASGALEAGARWGVDGSRVYAKCFDKGPPPCRRAAHKGV